MKLDDLKKTLLKRGIVYGVLSLLMLGGAYGASEFTASQEDEKNRIQSELNGARNEFEQLKKQINETSEAYQVYKKINATGTPDLIMDRDAALTAFKELQLKYLLGNLTTTAGDEVEFKGELANLRSGKLVYRTVSLEIQSATDSLVYAAVQEIKERLPGYLVVQGINLSRNADLTQATMAQARLGKPPLLVSGEIKLMWLGIKPEVSAQPGKT